MIRRALERGMTLAVVDYASSPVLPFAHLQVPVHELFDVPELRAALDRVGKTVQPTAVLTFYDEVILPTAEFAERMGCPFLTPQAALLAYNKVRQREALAEAGLPIPGWQTCDDLAGALAAAEGLGYPVILKVAEQAGGIGKIRINSPAELEHSFDAVDATRICRAIPLLVEQLMVGDEYDIEGFVTHGDPVPMCVSSKIMQSGPCPVVLAHTLPYRGLDARELGIVSAQAVAALGITNSFFDAEIIVTPAGPKIVEVNARAAGDCIMELIELACGVNPYDVLFDVAEGTEPVWEPHWARATAIRFITARRRGSFRSLEGMSAVLADPHLENICIEARTGAPVRPAEDNGDRLGWVLSTAADWQAALEQVDRIAASLSVTVSAERAGIR
jgi:biotin carboxylase